VLSHAFCCLIASMEDISVQVSQRATVQLGTIHDHAVKTLVWSLEYQFEAVPVDRPVILKRLYQLFNCLHDRRIVTWSFFANRFESLIGEIQTLHEHRLDLSGAMGSGGNNPGQRSKKGSMVAVLAAATAAHAQATGAEGVSQSQQGLAAAAAATTPSVHTSLRTRLLKNQAASSGSAEKEGVVRSLAASLKYPYKRTISAPAGMGLSIASKVGLQHQASQGSNFSHQISHTPYSRQQSVPLMLRTGTTKHGSIGFNFWHSSF